MTLPEAISTVKAMGVNSDDPHIGFDLMEGRIDASDGIRYVDVYFDARRDWMSVGGYYSADQLEALAVWMRAAGGQYSDNKQSTQCPA